MDSSNTEPFGFLLIDKEPGFTSHDVVGIIRKNLHCKVGHAGTLDPFATGLLLIALGKATRLLEYAQKLDKVYEAEITLGEERDTYDLTGEVVASSNNPNPAAHEIESALASMVGNQEQVPPAYSAIKIKGKKSYDLAREGKAVALASRDVTIYGIKPISVSGNKIIVQINCSSGTYIRSIAHDLGIKLTTYAFVSKLRRLSIGEMTIDNPNIITDVKELDLEIVQSKIVSPLAVIDLQQVEIGESLLDDFASGKEIVLNDPAARVGPAVALHDSRVIGVCEIIDGNDKRICSPKKVFI